MGNSYTEAGCKIPNSVVYPEFNELNSDSKNPNYNTRNGIYKNNCGLDNTMCSSVTMNIFIKY